MSELGLKERSLEETSTWAVAIVCFVLVSISLLIEHALLAVGKWMRKLQKAALVEALEKLKTELMLMGFLSILLTLGQGPITQICISPTIASAWLPLETMRKDIDTSSKANPDRHLLQQYFSKEAIGRFLIQAPIDHCSEKGQVAFVSGVGIHQLHYFIFVLAVFQVIYCVITYILGKTKMKKWEMWEEETKSLEYLEQIGPWVAIGPFVSIFKNVSYDSLRVWKDPERSRVAKDTSFGRRHLKAWSRPLISLWIVCFFRQFTGSVTKVDYRTLRHGFIMAHLAPGSESKFNFQNYIDRSLEVDFKEVVGISPLMWFIAILFLLANTYGSYSYLWLPFIPLVIALLIGTKLQVIITRMGLRIQAKGEVIKGVLVVQPGDDLFWFRRPRLVLFLIHLILFQNAFQLAFFFWSWWKFGIKACIHNHRENVVIRIAMGVLIQVLCSYVTLPLYALVSQMGSSYRPIIFNERIVEALKSWHRTAKKRARESRHSESVIQYSSATVTASSSASPVHPSRSSSATNSDVETDSPKKWELENNATVISIHCNYNEEDDNDNQEDVEAEEPYSEDKTGELVSNLQHEITIEEDDVTPQQH